jgi:hypothetical protein
MIKTRIGDSVLVIGTDVDKGSTRIGQTGKVLYTMGEFIVVIFDKTAALFKSASLEEINADRKP